MVSLRDILRATFDGSEEKMQEAISLTKQKLIQMRPLLSKKIDSKRIDKRPDGFISTDEIMDTVYEELDDFCSGLDSGEMVEESKK